MNLGDFFDEWPFSVVPKRGDEVVWADRAEVKDSADRLLRGFSFRPHSTLDLLWAAFGSGKTHLLYYLEAESRKTEALLPWYATLPKGVKKFPDVFRELMESFPFEGILPHLDVLPADSAILPVLRAYRLGTVEQKALARDWLSGRKVDMRTAPRLVSAPYKLETPRQMFRVLDELLATANAAGFRILLLLDEYQRVAEYPAAVRGVVDSTILDLFNAVPRGFSVIFTFSAIQQRTAEEALSPELRDRMRGRKNLELPTMEETQAVTFVSDLLRAFRPHGFDRGDFAPFDPDAIRTTVTAIYQAEGLQLIPRHLIQVLDAALGQALEEGKRSVTEAHLLEAVSTVKSSTT